MRGAGIWIADAAALPIELARIAVDASGSPRELTDKDRILLDALGSEILDNLAAALGQALKIAPSARHWDGPPERGALLFALALPGGMALRCAVPDGALVAFRKSLIASPVRVAPPAVGFADVIGEEGLALAVQLGEARVTARSLMALVEGDVLMLDTALDSPVAIVSQVSGRTAARAHVGHDGSALTLTVAH